MHNNFHWEKNSEKLVHIPIVRNDFLKDTEKLWYGIVI